MSANNMSFLIPHDLIEGSKKQFNVTANLKSISPLFEALDEYWLSVSQIIEATLDEAVALDKNSVKLLLEEVFVNIVHYGQCEDSEVVVSLALCELKEFNEFKEQQSKLALLLQLEDQGIAFNPLKEAPEPVLGLKAEEAPIGGLGVHLIKSMSIEQRYQRNSNSNQLCLLLIL